MKKILITGAGSYIGTCLADWLGHSASHYQIDTIDMQNPGWKEMSFVGYDSVVHVAGIVHIKESARNADLYYAINRDLALETAQKAKKEGVNQFIFMSSMSVYGMQKGMIEQDTVARPNTHYGCSKLQAEELILPLQTPSFAIAIVRPPMIYGRGCKGNYQKLARIVRRIHLFPDFRNQRSMLYIDNLCEFIRLLVDDGASGLFFPQNQEYVCTADMARMIAKSNHSRFMATRVFNWLIRLTYNKDNLVGKIFNDLTYSRLMSQYKQPYQVCSFANSIRLSEGVPANQKAVCISCFNYYDNRLRYISEYMTKQGYEVTNITSDFDHIGKKRYQLSRPATIQLKVLAYQKNLSPRRILSHYGFSRSVYRALRQLDPELLYVMLPPNSLASVAARFKKENPCTLIFDVYDLWPETFPLEKYKKLLGFVFRRWSNMRDLALSSADIVITECAYYHDALRATGFGGVLQTLRLTREGQANAADSHIDINRIEICYLGSINNIIDIDTIVLLLKKMNAIRPAFLHIIGDGEARDLFLRALDEACISYQYYGAIFDSDVKSGMFEKCQYGLNIMRSSVYVGLTMKSIDYFMAGLPILNTIKGDTEALVHSNQIGFNLDVNHLDDTIIKICSTSLDEWKAMKQRVLAVFREEFSIGAFNNKIELILSPYLYRSTKKDSSRGNE
jgi:nucleoside-diphosphate-sugar epimerase